VTVADVRGRIACLTRRGGAGPVTALSLLLLVTASATGATDDASDLIVIKAGRVHTVAGAPIDNGVVVVREGRIEAVGRDVAIPENARVIELPESVVTPGLVDACCAVGFEIPEEAATPTYGAAKKPFWRELGEHEPDAGDSEGDIDPDGPEAAAALAAGQSPRVTWAEQASEVTPHRLVIDSINLFSNDFERLMKGGVTTVYVTPDSANVIGSRGTIVKTAGPLDQRVVTRASAVKASMGGDPSGRGHGNYLPPYYGPPPTFHTRRPTTRMGVEWVFRKAFSDALRVRDGSKPYGADVPPAAAIPVLQQMLAGEIPLRIQARMQHDIFTALRVADEFDLKFVLEEATEAYRCLPQLKAAGVSVIYGPIFMTPTGWRRFSGEANEPCLNTAARLAEAGIKFALTAQELRDEEGLVRQGMYAVRNGLSAEEALRAITLTPAELLGLSGEIGVVAPGAVADIVAWSAEPFDATSRPLLVMIGGRVVYED
jgi:imidazolonepropionase-like amidohydrolase